MPPTQRAFPAWTADLIVYVPVVAILAAVGSFRVEGDTMALAEGAQKAASCLANMAPRCQDAKYFPLFQYLLAVPLSAAGVSMPQVAQDLAYASLGFGITAAVAYWIMGRAIGGTAGGHLALALLLSGYDIVYWFSSFGEMAAFALFSWLFAAAFLRMHWGIILILAFLCTITKEIAAPFVALTYALARLATIDWPAAWSSSSELPREVVIVAIAIAAGVAANAGFNWFRFGEWVNVRMLAPKFNAPPSAATAYFFYLFFSPAGGLLYVWFSLACFAAATLAFIRSRDTELVIFGLAALAVVAVNAGLAFWWSSFGWHAWGPRLTMPVLGGITLAILWTGRDMLTGIGSRRCRLIAQVLISLVVFASMLPNVLVLASPVEFFSRMFGPGVMDRLLGAEVITLEKFGPEIIKMAALDAYGRVVILPVTVRVCAQHPWIVVLVALYAALAGWRICTGGEPRTPRG